MLIAAWEKLSSHSLSIISTSFSITYSIIDLNQHLNEGGITANPFPSIETPLQGEQSITKSFSPEDGWVAPSSMKQVQIPETIGSKCSTAHIWSELRVVYLKVWPAGIQINLSPSPFSHAVYSTRVSNLHLQCFIWKWESKAKSKIPHPQLFFALLPWPLLLSTLRFSTTLLYPKPFLPSTPPSPRVWS